MRIYYISLFLTLISSLWLGIELEQAVGKNDGSVAGVRYFACKPSHGVFAPPSKVTKLVTLLVKGGFVVRYAEHVERCYENLCKLFTWNVQPVLYNSDFLKNDLCRVLLTLQLFTPLHQDVYSPYCSLYISYGT